MNIAINTLTTRNVAQNCLISKAVPFVLPLPEIRVLIMLIAIVISALGCVYIKDLNRRLFINYQEQLQIYQKLEVDKGELMLEVSALSNPARMQQLAAKYWNMEMPASEEVILIK